MELEILYICEKEYPNQETPLIQSTKHKHDHPEISIILSGSAKYTINQHTYTLKAGQLIVLTPGTEHSVIIPKPEGYRDLHLGISQFVGHLAEDTAMPYFENGFLTLNFGEERKTLTDLCRLLVEESNKRQSDYQIMLQSLVLQLLVHISRRLDHSSSHGSQSTSNLIYPDKHALVELIKDYIEDNYMKDISLEMFSKDMYFSQVYISKIFKEETGHSPIHFLIQKRLAVAKQLLENNTLPISEISRRVGYEDAYHFSKLFKKYYGYPPSTLKKKKHPLNK